MNDLEIAITRSSAVGLSRVLPAGTVPLPSDVVSITIRETVVEIISGLYELTLIGIGRASSVVSTSHHILLTVVVDYRLAVYCWTDESRRRP